MKRVQSLPQHIVIVVAPGVTGKNPTLSACHFRCRTGSWKAVARYNIS